MCPPLQPQELDLAAGRTRNRLAVGRTGFAQSFHGRRGLTESLVRAVSGEMPHVKPTCSED